MTKYLIALLGMVLITMGVSGCATLTESGKERAHVAGKVQEYNVYLFNEEFDAFWLIDTPSRLSQWTIR